MASPQPGVPAAINVYAFLPIVVKPGVDLDLSAPNWRWVHCLHLPLATLNALSLSRRPYRWIRYAIGVVVGARGDFSTASNCNVDLDFAGPLTEPADLYYSVIDAERRRMFPVDPDFGSVHITSSVHIARESQFHDEVADREQRKCALANMLEVYCDAAHLVAHSKGHEYISTFTRRRSRDPTGNDIVDNIDDVRNGIFINKFTHCRLGEGVAFLVTPNFAMDTTDIDPIAPPEEERCTAHIFQLSHDTSILGDSTLHSGAPLSMSHTPDWPPAILFDAVYANAVLHNFGTQELKDAVTRSWKDTFYPGGINTASAAEFKFITDKRASTARRTQDHADERQGRYLTRHGPDVPGILLNESYVLDPLATLKATKANAEAAVTPPPLAYPAQATVPGRLYQTYRPVSLTPRGINL